MIRGLSKSSSVAFIGVGNHNAEIWYEILDGDNTQWFDCPLPEDNGH